MEIELPMKQCPYCGAKYADEVTVCATDNTPLDPPKERKFDFEGTWKIYLSLLSVSAGLNVLLQIVFWHNLDNAIAPGILFLQRLVIFFQPFCIATLWLNSRLGVLLYFVLSLASIGASMAAGYHFAFIRLIWSILLVALAVNRWNKMHWWIRPVSVEKDES